MAQWTVMGVLRIYKCAVSPVLHTLVGPFGGCRFQPTCSAYAHEAVKFHGVAQGGWLTLRRVCRCHPWGSCGLDPVPNIFNTQNEEATARHGFVGEEPSSLRN